MNEDGQPELRLVNDPLGPEETRAPDRRRRT